MVGPQNVQNPQRHFTAAPVDTAPIELPASTAFISRLVVASMPLPSKQIVQSLSVQNQMLVDDAQIRNQLIVISEHCLNRLRIGGLVLLLC